jgi:hypothetical protein
MIRILDILLIWTPVVEALDARGRFQAMKNMPDGAARYPWLIPAIGIGLGLVVLVVGALAVYHRLSVGRRKRAGFSLRASKAGLDARETELLWAVSQCSRGDMPEAVLTIRGHFEESTSRFLASRKFFKAMKDQQDKMRSLLSTVGGKLGFPPVSGAVKQAVASAASSQVGSEVKG